MGRLRAAAPRHRRSPAPPVRRAPHKQSKHEGGNFVASVASQAARLAYIALGAYLGLLSALVWTAVTTPGQVLNGERRASCRAWPPSTGCPHGVKVVRARGGAGSCLQALLRVMIGCSALGFTSCVGRPF